jgi:chorismate mutase
MMMVQIHSAKIVQGRVKLALIHQLVLLVCNQLLTELEYYANVQAVIMMMVSVLSVFNALFPAKIVQTAQTASIV